MKCGAEAIVTFNLRHFPDTALDNWNIEAQHPDEFPVHLYHLNSDLIVKFCTSKPRSVVEHWHNSLAVLKQGVPNFAQLIVDSVGIAVD